MKTTPLHSFKTQLRLLAASLFLGLCAPVSQSADIFGPATTVDYQGLLLDGNGDLLAPAAPANYQVQFRIYDAQSGGAVIWAESQLVTVTKGKFSVRLGEGTTILGLGGADVGSVLHDSPGLPGAFNGRDRFLGLTVIIPGQTPGEISPRLAFLTSPFSFVAGTAGTLTQAPGTQSNVTVGSLAYSTQTVTTSGVVDGNSHTVLVNATTAQITTTLPLAGAQKELFFAKTDASAFPVVVAPPAGGTINGSTASISLITQGESLTLQNTGGNAWWIVSDTRNKGVPTGTLVPFGGALANVPSGYRQCDGASVLKTDYPALYAAIGNAWGSADATHFNLPDMRGRFPRGVDGGTGRDENANSRLLAAVGGNSGNNVGTVEIESFQAHAHGVNDPGHSHGASAPALNYFNTATTFGSTFSVYAPGATGAPGYSGTSTIGVSAPTISTGFTNISIQAAGGSETRPDNAAVYYIIKF